MISFVIPAHDEAALIGATLDALRTSATELGAPYEIIVVDDASSDDTAAIARVHGADVISVELRHIAATRNSGATHARGDILFFIDADTLVGSDVIKAALDALADGAVGGGAAVRLESHPTRYSRIAEKVLVWLFRNRRIAPGCFIFCTRAAFDAAGGFDTQWFAGEDVAFSRSLARLGRFVILREAVLTSPRKLRTHTLREHLQLAARLGRRGRGLLKSREGLELWYGKRR